ncbi:MAG: ABC transporter ATP-binding protein/permease [Anaerovibrio sp.]|uniref:ABC transporter ATP-binding protein/permease n=1 Tax=Anaerovibrio sp. TaxID=1872532 RepID=UPI0025FF2102|nr:ABC transporter ATP-binding protein/permease [Anaerovibrio sp.]MCR5176752.1 ABC transporter ATP-binding protein/permease [Anaerovibrio sp.]
MAKNAWIMMRSYWKSEERWWARGLLAVIVVLSLGQVYMLVLLNQWNNDFYNALQNYDYPSFWPLIGHFTLIAFIYIIMAVYAVYLRQMLQIKWRTWMTRHYLRSWMAKQVYYKLQVLNADMDNPDQRISEDINAFIELTLSLALGFLTQLTTLLAFIFVLWNLSGILNIPLGDTVISVPGYMVFLCLFYSIVGTWLAHKVGRRLISLNYDQQRYEADFRFNMVRVRENSESIAFYQGELPELEGFEDRFKRVIKNFWGLMKRTKLLNFYINGYGQLAIIFPVLMAAPKYFAGEMQLGGLMQTLSAFGRVQDALSYFVNVYDSIAKYVAVIRRLSNFTDHMEEIDRLQPGFARTHSQEHKMVLRNMDILLPDGKKLLEGLNFEIPAGEYILISGKSGTGKSTLLRALAEIWPYGQGSIAIPDDWRVMFLPQRPYLPLGTLRQAIYYPQSVPKDEAADLSALLAELGLESLADRLDETDDWSRILSLGEQQRIAFIRIILFKPQLVFLDESTSAMDEGYEAKSYDMLRHILPQMAVVSVGHRSSIVARHDTVLRLVGNGAWMIERKL